jgi:hypothetical protein
MYTPEPHDYARLLVDDRIREATSLHLARSLRRVDQAWLDSGDPAAPLAPVAHERRHHSRLWTLVHFGHAYS